MSGALRVVQPGLLTTVQDLGRVGGQRLGIPVSGALDAVALRAANVVVGNPQDAGGLELAVMSPVLEVAAARVRVAVAGLGVSLRIERGDEGEAAVTVPALQSVTVAAGDRLRVTGLGHAAVAYLAVEGGFAIAPVLGSQSTYVRGGIGGLDGRALVAGDRLPLVREAPSERDEMSLAGLDLAPAARVRIVLGPQDDYFTAPAIAAFLAATYTVTREADRMGLRLEGATLEHAKGYNIVSDGIAPGSIQVPGSGQPIVLLADRQTTGGYPKIATVASADLPALGRMLPGMRLTFEAITVAEAETARRALEAMLAALSQRLQPVRSTGLDPRRLWEANLVGGVVSAVTDEP